MFLYFCLDPGRGHYYLQVTKQRMTTVTPRDWRLGRRFPSPAVTHACKGDRKPADHLLVFPSPACAPTCGSSTGRQNETSTTATLPSAGREPPFSAIRSSDGCAARRPTATMARDQGARPVSRQRLGVTQPATCP